MWNPITDDITSLRWLDNTRKWETNEWRNVAIYLYGKGVVSLGDFLPRYNLIDSGIIRIVHFISFNDSSGIRLSLNKDREIVIVNQEREILAEVGFFCELADSPGCYCDYRKIKHMG